MAKSNPRSRSARFVTESLEDRVLLSGYFDNVADLVTGPSGVINNITQGLQATGSATNRIPLLNKPARSISQLTNDLNTFRPQLDSALRSLDPSSAAAAIQTAIYNALQPLNVLGDKNGDGQVTAADVYVSNVSASGVDVSLDLAESTTFTTQMGLGLDAIPFLAEAGSNASVTIGMVYHNFNFGYHGGSAYFSASAPNALQFSISGDLPSSAMYVDLGFMRFSATDGTPGVHDLSLTLSTGITSNGQISSPTLSGALHLLLNLDAQTPFNGLPQFRAGFQLDWNFPTISLATGATGPFGVPTLALNNVQMNLGSLLGGVLQPIAERIQEVTEPFQPVLDLVVQRIPVLSDFSQAFGGPTINLLTLSQVLSVLPDPPEGVINAINTANKLRQFVDAINTIAGAGGSGWLDLGSFPITGPGGASLLNTSPANLGNAGLTSWSSLVPTGTGTDFAGIQQQITNLLGSDVGGQVNDLWNQLTASFDDNGVVFNVPAVSDPASVALGMLLGQDHDLVTMRAKFSLDFDTTIPLSPIPVLLVDLIAQAHAIAYANLGYDTRGLREAIAPVYSGGSFDPTKLLDGLWIDQSTGLSLTGGISLEAGAGIPDVAKVVINGGLSVNLNLTLSNPNNLPKVRPFAGDLGSYLFTSSGTMDASAGAEVSVGTDTPVGFVGFKKDWSFGSVNIFHFNTNSIPIPGDLQPASVAPIYLAHVDSSGNLILSMGDNSSYLGDPSLIAVQDQAFTVTRSTYLLRGIVQVSNTLVVSAFGLQQRFTNIHHVFALAGNGNDTITVNDSGEQTDYYLDGGGGNDVITVNGLVNATLVGGAGDDTLSASASLDTLYMEGGPGANTFILGNGNLNNLSPNSTILLDPGYAATLLIDDGKNSSNTNYSFYNVPGTNQWTFSAQAFDAQGVAGPLRYFNFYTGLIINLFGGSGNDSYYGYGPIGSAIYGGTGNDAFYPDAYGTASVLPDYQYASTTFDGGGGYNTVVFDNSAAVGQPNVELTYGVVRWGANYNSGVEVDNIQNLQIVNGTNATTTLGYWNGDPIQITTGRFVVDADYYLGIQTPLQLNGVTTLDLVDVPNNNYTALMGLDAIGPYVSGVNGSGVKLRFQLNQPLTTVEFEGFHITIDPAVGDAPLGYYVIVAGNAPGINELDLYSPNYGDPNATAPDRTYTLGSSYAPYYGISVGTLNIFAGGINDFVIYGGQGNDTFDVNNIPSGVVFAVDGGYGNDTLNVGNATTPFSTGVLGTLDWGGDAGTDSVSVDDTHAAGGQHYTIGAGSVQDSSGGMVATKDASNESYVFDGTLSNFNFYNIQGSGHGIMTLVGGPLRDFYTLYNLGFYAGPLTIQDAGGGDALQLNNSTTPTSSKVAIYADHLLLGSAVVNYSGLGGLSYSGASAPPPFTGGNPFNTVYLVSLAPQDSFYYYGTDAAVDTVYLGSDDGVTGSLASLLGHTISISLGSQPANASDSIIYVDSNDPTSHSYESTSTGLNCDGALVATVSGPENITLIGGVGNDAIKVDSNTGESNLSIATGAGTNAVNLTSGDLAGITPNISIDGTGGSTSVNYNEPTQVNAPFIETFNIVPTGFIHQVGYIVHAGLPPRYYQVADVVLNAVSQVTINGSPMVYTNYYLKGTAPGERYDLYCNHSQDSFYAGNNGDTSGIQSPVHVYGSSASTISIDDSANTSGVTAHIDSTDIGGLPGDNLFGAGGLVYPSGVSSVALTTGSGADLIGVTPNPSWPISINEGAPTTAPGDLLEIELGAATSPVLTGANLATGSGTYTFANAQPITFAGAESVSVVSTSPLVLSGSNNYLRLDADGVNVDLWNSTTATGSPNRQIPLAQISTINWNATGNPTLVVDESQGDLIPAGGISFSSGNGGTLDVIGTTGDDAFSIGSSTVSVNASQINYSGLSSIVIDAGSGGNDALIQSAQPGNNASLAFINTSGADSLNIAAGSYSIPASPGGISQIDIGALTIGAGAAVTLLSNPAYANQTLLELGSLSLAGSMGAWTGTLDLGNNDLIVHNGDIAALTDQVLSGYNAGGAIFAGPTGIRSSSAADDPSLVSAIGLAQAQAGQTFDGQTNLAATDVLIRYTYFGDASLDGQVDSADYSLIDNGFLNKATGWSNGDFNYDGVVNGSDYTLIDNAFNSQGASLASQIIPPAASGMNQIAAASRNVLRADKESAAAFSPGVFNASTPITWSGSSGQSVEDLLVKKDRLDGLLTAAGLSPG